MSYFCPKCKTVWTTSINNELVEQKSTGEKYVLGSAQPIAAAKICEDC